MGLDEAPLFYSRQTGPPDIRTARSTGSLARWRWRESPPQKTTETMVYTGTGGHWVWAQVQELACARAALRWVCGAS